MRRAGHAVRDSIGVVAASELNLLLIGLRGSGKTTIGRALAERERRAFLDLDDVTAAFLGCDSVAEAWERHGEGGFREAEARALAAVLHDSGRIIALGGGTPTAPGAAELIDAATREARAVVVYLRCTPAELRARLASLDDAAMANRPSLTGGHPLDEVGEIFARRDGLYVALASRVIEGIETIGDALTAFRGWQQWA